MRRRNSREAKSGILDSRSRAGLVAQGRVSIGWPLEVHVAKGHTSSVVNAAPEKSFFIHMITRDIQLEDCILDLLDNSIDGALRLRGPYEPWLGLRVRIEFDSQSFSIADNCGGMSLDVARNYAFHFGRPKGAPQGGRTIGLYPTTYEPMKGFVFVAPEGVESDRDLGAWVKQCATFVRTLPPK